MCVVLERFVPPAILDVILALRAEITRAFPWHSAGSGGARLAGADGCNPCGKPWMAGGA
jgi:hypothetical protein